MKQNNENTEISEKEIFDWIKKILYVFAGLTVIVAFIKNIRYFMLNFFVSNRLDAVDKSYWLDILVITTVFTFAALQVHSCINSRPNKYFSFFLLLTIPIYLFERYTEGFFIFTDFKILNSIAYFDLFLLIPLIHFGGHLKFLFPGKLKPQINSLLDDSPIEKIEDDELGGLYDDSAAKIFNILNDNKFNSAFTVGLNGEWGDGKTSVFNLLKAKITGEDFIVFDFNPWMGYDKKVLVRDFFTALSESLGQDLADEFGTYSEELLDNGNTFSIPRLIRNIFYRKKSLKTSFEEINEKIGLIQKKIIVFIDDVDRLDKEEIFELLKLLRNTANFQNVFFIVAYDRTYVNESIKAHSAESTIKYLDKIVNVEISLPYFDKYILKDYFQQKLRDQLPEDADTQIDNFLKSYDQDPLLWDLGYEQDDLFIYWLNNFRDIKKVINSICVNYRIMYNRVNFSELVHLEILKLRHPELYRLIFFKRHEILKEHKTSNVFYLKLFKEALANAKEIERILLPEYTRNHSEPNTPEKEDLTMFDIYLDIYVRKNSISIIERDKILDLITRLFPRRKKDNESYDVNDSLPDWEKSVRYVSKFERYFSQTIFEKHIDEPDYDKFLMLNSKDELYNKIDIWIGQGKIKDLTHRLSRQHGFENSIIYKNVLLSSIYIFNKDIRGSFIDINNVISKMINRDFSEGLFKNVDEAKSFFTKLFKEVTPPHQAIAHILHTLRLKNKRKEFNDPYRFPLSDLDIYTILDGYVSKFIVSENQFENGFWDLLFKTVKEQAQGTGNNSPQIKVITGTIKKQTIDSLHSTARRESFLKSLIYRFGNYDFKIRVEAILLLFDDFVSFEKYFFENGFTSSVISEFKEFYDKSKSINWEDTEFHFKIINEDDLS